MASMLNQPVPAHTSATDLTDDQLLLFDFIFNIWIPLGALSRERDPWNMHVGSTHTLSDAQLAETLQELSGRHLIQSRPAGIAPAHTLTAGGGALWEQERRPDWDAFCESSHPGLSVSVIAPILTTAETFLRVCYQPLVDEQLWA
jgi:hypothetical protein